MNQATYKGCLITYDTTSWIVMGLEEDALYIAVWQSGNMLTKAQGFIDAKDHTVDQMPKLTQPVECVPTEQKFTEAQRRRGLASLARCKAKWEAREQEAAALDPSQAGLFNPLPLKLVAP